MYVPEAAGNAGEQSTVGRTFEWEGAMVINAVAGGNSGFAAQGELFCAGDKNIMAHLLNSEADIASAALGLGAAAVPTVSKQESALLKSVKPISSDVLQMLQAAVASGKDPLGDAFARIRSADARRLTGATYTPKTIVSAMVRWSKQQTQPVRIIEPGTGSARFLLAAGRAFPSASLLGYEIDPLAALIARANLSAARYVSRAEILLEDYRAAKPRCVTGPTLFIGNPPYVRHHQIAPDWKQWLTQTAAHFGYHASQLAGLHVHFYLATLVHAKPGDFGVYITAAEWLDVNYGELVRQMFLDRLGGHFIAVIEPTARAFEDAAATAAIAGFVLDSRAKSIRVSRVSDIYKLGSLTEGHDIHRGRLEVSRRWSHLTRKSKSIPEGYVELGELCRVHRGQVTGANKVWIAGRHSIGVPDRFLYPTVTRARELFAAGTTLKDASGLRDVIDIPAELDGLDGVERLEIDRFLRFAKAAGADKGYIAENRRAWWSVGLRAPAPILATYMARRPPAFVRNLAAARHINIAHGLYPREPLPCNILDRLAKFLSKAVSVSDGRTYQGGLTKFEPREMERLFVPSPDLLRLAAT